MDAEAGAFITPLAQVVEALGVGATNNPAGRSSFKAACVKGVPFGLVIRMVNVEGDPAAVAAVPVVNPFGLPVSKVKLSKALLIVMGCKTRKTSDVG